MPGQHRLFQSQIKIPVDSVGILGLSLGSREPIPTPIPGSAGVSNEAPATNARQTAMQGDNQRPRNGQQVLGGDQSDHVRGYGLTDKVREVDTRRALSRTDSRSRRADWPLPVGHLQSG